jgi:hypothetical protein
MMKFIAGENTTPDEVFEAKLKALAEPFEEDEVYWLPQSVKGNTAVAAAYANKRAYTDRLDYVLTPAGWQIEIDPPTVTEYIKIVKQQHAIWNDPSSPITVVGSQDKSYKVMIKARCGVWVDYMNQWVWKASTGVCEAADENSITTAEAQAVKRAISMWGPGNYFYRLGTQTVPYSKATKQFTVKPTLPEWAIPVRKCVDCALKIAGLSWNNKEGNQVSLSSSEVLKIGRAKYHMDLCSSCQRARRDS